MMDLHNTKKIKIQRFEDDHTVGFRDVLLSEKSFALFLNGDYIERITCTGSEIKELITGHLYSEHRIRSASDLSLISVNDKTGSIYAEIKTAVPVPVIRNCEGGERFVMSYTAVINIFREFQEMSVLFKETGGVHSAALADGHYRICYFSEDMSRYNAVDKVVGKALIDGFDPGSAMLITSSRMPLELIQKASHACIKTILSVSAPTLESVYFARENHIVLLGMFRNNRINIYSGSIEG